MEPETHRPTLAIYTVNGEFVRRIQLDERVHFFSDIKGITVTVEGHIAVAFDGLDGKLKVIVLG